MVSGLLASSSNLVWGCAVNPGQKFARLMHSSQSFVCIRLSHIFRRTFAQASCNGIKSDEKTLKLLTSSTKEALPMPKNMLSFDEFKKQYQLVSFEQYRDKCKFLVKDDEKESAEAALRNGYDIYLGMCYGEYKQQFFPPCNPLIL